MNNKGMVVAVLTTLCLTAALFMTSPTRSNPGIAAGTYQTGVFSKVYGTGGYILLYQAPIWTIVASLKLPNVPVTAYYHVVCDGQAWAGNEFEIAIGFDYLTYDSATRRLYTEDAQGIHTERVYKLGPGAHTFHFKGRKNPTSGDVAIDYQIITVTVFTDGSVIDLSGSDEATAFEDGR